MSHPLFWLAALFVFCLCLGGNAAEGALPAPPPIPDSLADGDTGKGQLTEGQEQQQTSNHQDSGSAPKSSDLPAPPQNAAATAPPANQDIAAKVANFFNNPTSADEAMKLFRTADASPDKTDKDYQALHRLLWYAWQLGNTDAAFTYGRLFDPLEPQWWTVKKDAERALAYYQSVALPNQEALAAMHRLRDWINSGKPAR